MLERLDRFISDVTEFYTTEKLYSFKIRESLWSNPYYYSSAYGAWGNIFIELRTALDIGSISPLKYLGEKKEGNMKRSREYAGKLKVNNCESYISYVACDVYGTPEDSLRIATDNLCYSIRSGSHSIFVMERKMCAWADEVIFECV